MSFEQCRLLIIGTSKDSHIDSVIAQLDDSISFCRFDVDKYPTEIKLDIFLANGKNPEIRALIASTAQFDLSGVRTVWFRRIGAPQLDKRIINSAHRTFALGEIEAVVSGLAHLLTDAHWVSSYEATKRASVKPYQLMMAIEVGLTIPPTLITNNEGSFHEFRSRHDLVLYKTLYSPSVSYKDRRTLIFSHILTDSDSEYLHQVAFCPCCFQSYIEKKYELRITYAGHRFHTVRINSQASRDAAVDWRADIHNVEYEPSNLPLEVEKKLTDLMVRLNLEYGAIDMIVTPHDEYVFLEVNPHGAWGWLENRLDIPISKSIAQYLSELSIVPR